MSIKVWFYYCQYSFCEHLLLHRIAKNTIILETMKIKEYDFMSKGFVFSYDYVANLYAFYLTVSDISNQYSKEVIGLVDTGSDVSLISQNIIRELHLEKVGNRSVDTAQGTYQSDEYFVNVKLSYSFMVNNLKVSSTIMDNADFIMGTDILSKGDLLIENSGGKTKITFTLN